MAEQSYLYGTIAQPQQRTDEAVGINAPVDPFADRASLIVRELLRHAQEVVWTVRALAAASHTGVATTSRVLQQLAHYGVVSLARRGRQLDVRLADVTALFDRWFSIYHWTQNAYVAFAIPMGDPVRFLRRVPRLFGAKTRWALTMQAGAAVIAPHALWGKVHMYVDVTDPRELVRYGAMFDGYPDPLGQLILMRPYYASAVWSERQRVNDLYIVDDLQLVLDLWNYPLRGREQAEHLIEWRMREHGRAR